MGLGQGSGGTPVALGLELTRRLKENIDTSHIPIILLTARNSPDDRVECYRAGANGYISKPFETKVLEARIDNIISSRRKERETLHRQPDSNPVKWPPRRSTRSLSRSSWAW